MEMAAKTAALPKLGQQLRAPHCTPPSGPGRQYFYWLCPARTGDKAAPLLIWLNGGGPGSSSMMVSSWRMVPTGLLTMDRCTREMRRGTINTMYCTWTSRQVPASQWRRLPTHTRDEPRRRRRSLLRVHGQFLHSVSRHSEQAVMVDRGELCGQIFTGDCRTLCHPRNSSSWRRHRQRAHGSA